MNKPPVLFIPGTLCTPAVFRSRSKELKQLASQVDVVKFSLEDTISSMADMAIRHISAEKGAAIVGFSMGGMIAMEIVRKAPKLVKKLALLNTNIHADLPDRQTERAACLALAETESMENIIRQCYLDRYLHQQTTYAVDLIIQMASEMGKSSFSSQVNALTHRRDSTNTLAEIDCPTLVLGSEHDELCPPSGQKQMQGMIRNSELVLLEDCGHFSTLEKPAEVNRALRNWYLQS